MKKVLRPIVLLMAFAMAFSCNNTDDENEDQKNEDANAISNNAEIKGGSKINGEPPTPNGGVSLVLVNPSTAAYEDAGLTIPISSDGDIIGAYLRFKSEDGTPADNYYDINIEDNLADKSAMWKTIFNVKKKNAETRNNSAKIEDDIELKIGLSPEVKAGETFCYEICVYDAQGNISQPQELCVTVNAWANNSDLTGKWNILYESELYYGTVENYYVKQDYCSQTTITCNSGQIITVDDYCDNLDYEFLDLKSNGDFIYEYELKDKVLELDPSITACAQIMKDDSSKATLTGKWSYDSDKQALVFVAYHEVYIDVDGTETYDYSNDPIVDVLPVKVNGDSMELLYDWYDENGDGNPEEYYKGIFEKE